jgi:hypothetical protein
MNKQTRGKNCNRVSIASIGISLIWEISLMVSDTASPTVLGQRAIVLTKENTSVIHHVENGRVICIPFNAVTYSKATFRPINICTSDVVTEVELFDIDTKNTDYENVRPFLDATYAYWNFLLRGRLLVKETSDICIRLSSTEDSIRSAYIDAMEHGYVSQVDLTRESTRSMQTNKTETRHRKWILPFLKTGSERQDDQKYPQTQNISDEANRRELGVQNGIVRRILVENIGRCIPVGEWGQVLPPLTGEWVVNIVIVAPSSTVREQLLEVHEDRYKASNGLAWVASGFTRSGIVLEKTWDALQRIPAKEYKNGVRTFDVPVSLSDESNVVVEVKCVIEMGQR